jgi:hypothetical protein
LKHRDTEKDREDRGWRWVLWIENCEVIVFETQRHRDTEKGREDRGWGWMLWIENCVVIVFETQRHRERQRGQRVEMGAVDRKL